MSAFLNKKIATLQGFFKQFWEKAPGQNLEKLIDLKSKLGEINDIEHNKGSKIYPQNQAILDILCQAYHLSTSFLSIILTWVIVSHKLLFGPQRRAENPLQWFVIWNLRR